MYWYNGELVGDDRISLDINDPGLLYGATIFTTVRVHDRSLDHPLTRWRAHRERLYSSVLFFGWSFPDRERLRAGAARLASVYPVLRIALFPDGREWIIGRSLPGDLEERRTRGVTGRVMVGSIYERAIPAHKTGNYLGAWSAKNRAGLLSAGEAILVDRSGNWSETATGNLWGYRDGCWYTPSLDTGILGGIARDALLESLRALSIPAVENIWTPDFVRTLEGLAYSNCVVEVLPFRSVSWGDEHLYFDLSAGSIEVLQKYFRIF